MKKIFFLVLTVVAISISSAYAQENELFDIRNKVFDKSQEIRPLLTSSKDVVILNSVWDSCIITVTHLDAYFSMQGIFNAIRKEDINSISLDYLINWLQLLKSSNATNIKNLLTMSNLIEENTAVHLKTLKDYFEKIDALVSKEIERLSELKKGLKK